MDNTILRMVADDLSQDTQMPRKALIEQFVSKLWLHALLRASNASQETLHLNALQLRSCLRNINISEHKMEIGEALTAHVLNYVVKNLTRANCNTCLSLSSCSLTEDGPCNAYLLDEDVLAQIKINILDAIFYLDGAYYFDASQMTSVVISFLAQLKKES